MTSDLVASTAAPANSKLGPEKERGCPNARLLEPVARTPDGIEATVHKEEVPRSRTGEA
ncbi:MAG: hypothetical protein JW955_20505 [Sedimentisphaerales bacterium]|nr:hypothetical protein [Sedimentisphaerales bacterium]